MSPASWPVSSLFAQHARQNVLTLTAVDQHHQRMADDQHQHQPAGSAMEQVSGQHQPLDFLAAKPRHQLQTEHCELTA